MGEVETSEEKLGEIIDIFQLPYGRTWIYKGCMSEPMPEDCRIGYWETPQNASAEEQANEVFDAIVPHWARSDDARACVEYMKHGLKSTGYFGYANNRVTGKPMGTCDMITPDGQWQFPEKWWIYIEELSVKPNNRRFIRNAKSWWSEELRKEFFKKCGYGWDGREVKENDS